MTSDYQPHFAAYAAAHGRTPTEQVAHQGPRNNAGFTVWIYEQWKAWGAEAGRHIGRDTQLSPADHEAFDAWLAEQWPIREVVVTIDLDRRIRSLQTTMAAVGVGVAGIATHKRRTLVDLTGLAGLTDRLVAAIADLDDAAADLRAAIEGRQPGGGT